MEKLKIIALITKYVKVSLVYLRTKLKLLIFWYINSLSAGSVIPCYYYEGLLTLPKMEFRN